MDVCGIQLCAVGGATDGATWSCDQQAEHTGPHRMTLEMSCTCCEKGPVCSVSWDQHGAGRDLVTV